MCVIIYTKIGNKIILAKNRDRSYIPHVQIIHEILDGVEVAYIKDLDTGWVEGLNKYGCGMVNSTLNIFDGKNKNKKKMKKNNNILKIISKNNPKNIKNNLLENDKDIIEGHSLFACENKCLHVENSIKDGFLLSDIKKTTVFTNHGIFFDAGSTKGIKGLSSMLRKNIIEMELEKNKNNIKTYEDLLFCMNKNYNINPQLHPYRDNRYSKKYLHNTKNLEKINFVSTTSQLILNLTDKEFIFCYDNNNSKFLGYINKLPENYSPIIKIIIRPIQKKIKTDKLNLSKQYLNKLYKKFNYNVTKKRVIKINDKKNNKTQKNKTQKNKYSNK